MNLGIEFPDEALEKEFFGELYPRKRLPFTIDEEESLNAQKVIASIATQYLNMFEKFDYFGWSDIKGDPESPRDLIPIKVDEERSREKANKTCSCYPVRLGTTGT